MKLLLSSAYAAIYNNLCPVRPDYQKLGQLKHRTGSVPWAALTATVGFSPSCLYSDTTIELDGKFEQATPAVVEDIVTSLKLGKDYKTFKLPCFRKNIFYDVQFKDALTDEVEHLKAFVNKSLGPNWKDGKADKSSGCGIIYCRTR